MHPNMRLIEQWPLNGYMLNVYVIPNPNGKTYLDDYIGQILDSNGYEILNINHTANLYALKHQLLVIAKTLSSPYAFETYVPRFNKVRE